MTLLGLWLGSLLLLLVKADQSVHILSKYGNRQLITSSILNWIPENQYSATKNFVIGGFEIVDADEASEGTRRPIFVCRALHNGIWVAGGVMEGEKRCKVTLTGNVGSYERYQLLENVESAARLSWTNWDKYSQPPVGTVATDNLYVARHVAVQPIDESQAPSSQTHYIGTLNSEDTLGTITYVKEDGKEASADNGQLLVETEPTSYELNAVKLNHLKRRVAKRVSRVLGEATIRNDGPEPAKLAEAIGYSYVYALYWGQGHAMFKGLPTDVTMQDKTRITNMSWGIEIRENRTNFYTVEVYLEPGTAVNVTLHGDYVEIEVPYTGKLLSHYEDKALVNPRTISGMRREETIIDVKPEFGAVYYLGNFSLVPTTAAPPTTEAPSTTTAATTQRLTTTSPAQPPTDLDEDEENEDSSSSKYGKDGSAEDENAIRASRPEATGMQGDDGGPLSLNKPEGSQNAAPVLAFLESLFLVLAMPAILARVT